MKSTSNNSGVAALRNAMLFSLTRRAWSNRIKADKAKVQTTAAKKNLNLTKRLLNSKELDAIESHLADTYNWCLARAMPSTALRRGIYLVKRDMVLEFEDYLTKAELILEAKVDALLAPAMDPVLVPGPDGVTLVQSVVDGVPQVTPVVIDGVSQTVYDMCRLEMAMPEENGGLGDLYKASDYPTTKELRESFGIKWAWLALSVPNELPEEVREREVTKLKESFEAAQEEIKFALREGFKELIDRAVERLTPGEGGKPKVFRDTLVTNFNDFFETFSARNLMEDGQLAALVAQAKGIIGNVPVKSLREEAKVREATVAKFAEVTEVLNGLVAEKPSRRFNLEDES